jgi:putative membrane protein
MAPPVTDLLLAIGHHLLVFALPIVLTMEIMLTRPGMSAARLTYLGRLDMAYGAIAAGVLVVGIGRVFLGLRGPDYYAGNAFFWAKIAAFLTMGVLSIPPTLRIIGWRAAALGDGAFTPPAADIAGVRRFLHAEATVFVLIPVFAALMARGYGS